MLPCEFGFWLWAWICWIFILGFLGLFLQRRSALASARIWGAGMSSGCQTQRRNLEFLFPPSNRWTALFLLQGHVTMCSPVTPAWYFHLKLMAPCSDCSWKTLLSSNFVLAVSPCPLEPSYTKTKQYKVHFIWAQLCRGRGLSLLVSPISYCPQGCFPGHIRLVESRGYVCRPIFSISAEL